MERLEKKWQKSKMQSDREHYVHQCYVVNNLLCNLKNTYYREVAELVPALKKHDADHEQFSNFRPISNLVMASKVIEKAVSVQLTDHVRTHHLEEWFQSDYKIHHSTETALVKEQNDCGQLMITDLCSLRADKSECCCKQT